MLKAFRIVNVFTIEGHRFSGNPLCVFEDARGLSDADMQALARQMNLSETTFVLPSERADARVRIFTPGFEMPFAGHPTLGTASVVSAGRDEVRLEMIAGVVSVTCSSPDTWTLKAALPPKVREVEATAIELARMLGLPDDAVGAEPRWVSTGVEQLVIPLRSAEFVRAARPVPALLERWGFSASRQEAMAYVWAADADGTLVVRFFFTSHGAVLEDPATGSACANLGGWLIASGRSLPLEYELLQGEATGRPSRLGLRVDRDAGIFVTGSVLELGRGTVAL
jgi:trans-2,3-dihydro-3-hydroxyanthranilate isomerase